jgi:DnaJ-class molecular chaperone
MSTDAAETNGERRTCSPCRGTGRVLSNLGGEQQEITCPWCEGSGEFKPEHDAQEQAPESSPGSGEEPAA